MKWAPLLLIMAALTLFSSCGERANHSSSATFSLQFDTSILNQNSSTDPSDRPTDPLLVAGMGRLEFFGVVVRKVDGAALNADGTAAGVIIPEASKMLTSFTNKTALVDILSTGQAAVELTVPMNTKLAVTTYLVFIGEDATYQYEGPTTLTTVFDVSPVFEVTSTNQQVAFTVDTSNVLDNAKPFINWYGAFATPTGVPLANTNIYLRHCKIGFEFSQEMFGATPHPTEANFFRTDADGWIDSVAIDGVDFQVRVGAAIVKPCGAPLLAKTFPTSPTPKIAFTGFIGGTRYNLPDAFWTALPSASQTQMFGSAAVGDLVDAGIASDADGDGLTTTQEMDSSITNPFQKNYYFEQKFGHDVAGLTGPYNEGGETRYYFRLATGELCSSATVSVFNPATSATLGFSSGPTITDITTAGESQVSCMIAFTGDATANGTDAFYEYVLEVATGVTPVTAPDGTSVPITMYSPLAMAVGTAPLIEKITAPSMVVRLRNWDTDSTLVVNPLTLKPQLDDTTDSEYFATITAADLIPGGVFFFGTEATCDPNQKDMNMMPRISYQVPGVAVVGFDYHENYDKTLWLCHMKAANTTFAAGNAQVIGQIKFLKDTTRSYGEVLNSYTGLGLIAPYTPSSMAVESPTRQVVCGLENALPVIHVLDSGTATEVDYSATTLNATTPGNAFAFVLPTGESVCAYNDHTNGFIRLIKVDASNLAVELPAITISGATGSEARFAYRNNILFVAFAGAAEVQLLAHNVSTDTSIFGPLFTGVTETSITNVLPLITAGGEYIVGHTSSSSFEVLYNNAGTFTQVAGSAQAMSSSAMNLYGFADDLGNYYFMTYASPEGSSVYKGNELTAGSLIFDSSTYLAPAGLNFLGLTLGRLTYTNGSETKFFDPLTSQFVNVMGTGIFYDMLQDASTATYYGGNIYYLYSQSSSSLMTTARVVPK